MGLASHAPGKGVQELEALGLVFHGRGRMIRHEPTGLEVPPSFKSSDEAPASLGKGDASLDGTRCKPFHGRALLPLHLSNCVRIRSEIAGTSGSSSSPRAIGDPDEQHRGLLMRGEPSGAPIHSGARVRLFHGRFCPFVRHHAENRYGNRTSGAGAGALSRASEGHSGSS